jgi:ATP-binding cassette, subfamily C (CFTR/MRP), member 1
MADDSNGACAMLTDLTDCRNQAAEYRHEEARRLRKMAWLNGAFGLVLFAGPVIVGVSSFAAYAAAGNQLSTAKAYTALALFTVLRFPMGFLPGVIVAVINVLVALNRIATFLSSSEVGGTDPDFSTDAAPGIVKVQDASFKWDEETDRDVTLSDISFSCKPGSLTMIVGSVGSGKSTLLACLFRQVTRLSGTVTVGGRLAYVPQTAWVMNETLRENVLMGEPMDEARCVVLPFRALLLVSRNTPPNLHVHIFSSQVGEPSALGDKQQQYCL